MQITVGSTSEHKLAAVREACAHLGISATVEGIKAASKVNEQPVGFEETFTGALNRASEARNHAPFSESVGIENGIIRFTHDRNYTFDLAWVVWFTPQGNRRIVTNTSGLLMPEELVEEAQRPWL